MNTKRIIYTRPDGGVSIVSPAPRRVAELMADDMTEAEAIDVIQAKSVPDDATDIAVVERATIPTDRSFRDAWMRPPGGGSIKVDMSKARAIQKIRVRDTKLMLARQLLEREMIGEDIVSEKAALQGVDADNAIDNATTVEQLKAAWPVVLDK